MKVASTHPSTGSSVRERSLLGSPESRCYLLQGKTTKYMQSSFPLVTHPGEEQLVKCQCLVSGHERLSGRSLHIVVRGSLFVKIPPFSFRRSPKVVSIVFYEHMYYFVIVSKKKRKR